MRVRVADHVKANNLIVWSLFELSSTIICRREVVWKRVEMRKGKQGRDVNTNPVRNLWSDRIFVKLAPKQTRWTVGVRKVVKISGIKIVLL